MKVHFDICGKPIKKGDYVIFAAREGDRTVVRVAIVLEPAVIWEPNWRYEDRVRVHSVRKRWDDQQYKPAGRWGDAKPNAMYVISPHELPNQAVDELSKVYEAYIQKQIDKEKRG